MYQWVLIIIPFIGFAFTILYIILY